MINTLGCLLTKMKENAHFKMVRWRFLFRWSLTLEVPSAYEKSVTLFAERLFKFTDCICQMCNILHMRAVVNTGWQIQLILVCIKYYIRGKCRSFRHM